MNSRCRRLTVRTEQQETPAPMEEAASTADLKLVKNAIEYIRYMGGSNFFVEKPQELAKYAELAKKGYFQLAVIPTSKAHKEVDAAWKAGKL